MRPLTENDWVLGVVIEGQYGLRMWWTTQIGRLLGGDALGSKLDSPSARLQILIEVGIVTPTQIDAPINTI